MTSVPLQRMVLGMGVTQMISWAALIYTIAVLGAPMGAELGVSETAIFGAFSLSLAISGLVAPRVGRTIDRIGGRRVLTVGTFVSAVSLFAIAVAPNIATYVLAWMVAGVAGAMTLYEPAFATLSQHAGSAFRRSVTTVTLFGALASTLCFLTTPYGLELFGWRWTLAVYGAVELVVCLPLLLWCIPAGPGARSASASTSANGKPSSAAQGSPSPRRVSRGAFVALATSFALMAFITSGVAVHVINLLRAAGLPTASAAFVASLIGPMQLAGRVLEFTVGRRWSSRAIGHVTLWAMTGSLAILAFVDASIAIAVVFAVWYGTANGVFTIIRGTAPAEIFGRDGYGHLLGRLSLPSFVARAIAPLALTFASTANIGFDLAPPLLAAIAALALATYAIAVRRPSS
jgi:MFS family permease